MINTIITFLTKLITDIGYLGVGFSMFLESFFAPIPSELIMPFAGFVSATGSMNILLVVLVGGISSYLGSLPFYFLGYWGNDLVVNRFLKKYGKYLFISEEDVDLGFKYFDKRGPIIVLLGRLVPIVRTVISFPAGVAKMKFGVFTLYTLIGSLMWSSLLGFAGYVLGDNWEVVGGIVSKYEKGIIAIGIVVVLAFIAYKIIKRKK